MHRTVGDAYLLSGGKRIYQPEAIGQHEATQVTYDAMNALQEEIAAVIEGGGKTLNGSSETVAQMCQLKTVLDERFTAEAITRNANDRITSGALIKAELMALLNEAYATTIKAGVLRAAAGRPNGFGTSRATATTITVAPGNAIAANYGAVLYRSAAITKDISAAWEAGDGNGGRAGALTDATWYYVFAIKSSNVLLDVDVGFDTSPVAANLLTASGYTYYRRIGAVYHIAAGMGIKDYTQSGDTWVWKYGEREENALTIEQLPNVSTVSLLMPSGAGLGIRGQIRVCGRNASNAWKIAGWPGILGAVPPEGYRILEGPAGSYDSVLFEVPVGSSQVVYFTEENMQSDTVISVYTRGWVDPLLA